MKSNKIVIIDYGMGNLGSIKNMFKYIGTEAVISNDHTVVEKADKIVLSGVGAFDKAMKNLNEYGLIPLLQKKVLEQGIPILGICLGMQLFGKSSEEGELKGLGWIDAQSIRFYFKDKNDYLKIPHMGWNKIFPAKKGDLLKDIDDDARFYFVHSYYVKCNDDDDVLSTSFYGHEFVSAIQKRNIMGVQFHPEKSHKFGMKILKIFSDLY